MAQDLSLIICHPCSCAFLLDQLLLFYFDLSFPVFFFSFHLLHCELYSELDNLIAMQNLRYSANKGSDDAYDVSASLTESGGAAVAVFSTGADGVRQCRKLFEGPTVQNTIEIQQFFSSCIFLSRVIRAGFSALDHQEFLVIGGSGGWRSRRESLLGVRPLVVA